MIYSLDEDEDEEDAESARVQLSAPTSAGELFHQGAHNCA